MNDVHRLAGGTRAEAIAAGIARWQPRPMPEGWKPTNPFTTEDGTGTPVEIPPWIPPYRFRRRPRRTTPNDPLLQG